MKPPRAPLALALSLMVACGRGAPPVEDEPFPELRRVWQDDPAAAMAMVNALDDELAQLTAIEAVMKPSASRDADRRRLELGQCELLEREAVRARCERWIARDHLAPVRVDRAVDPLAERACLAALPGGDRVDDTPLGTAVRMAIASKGRGLEAAWAPCGCLGSVAQEDECLFSLAESLHGDQHRIASTVSTCLQCSQAMASFCVEHALRMGAVTGPLDDPGSVSWVELRAAAAVIADSEKNHFPRQRWTLEDHFWAAVLHRSVMNALSDETPDATLSPDLVASLPSTANPQLRSAVAWAAVAMTSPGPARREQAQELCRQLLRGQQPFGRLDPHHHQRAFSDPEASCAQADARQPLPDRSYPIAGQLGRTREGARDAGQDLNLAVSTALGCQEPPAP